MKNVCKRLLCGNSSGNRIEWTPFTELKSKCKKQKLSNGK